MPHVVVAVNKIDLLGYSQDAFEQVSAQVSAVTSELGIADVHVLPVSALKGDNIVDRSQHTQSYDGPALLELLETLPAIDELETAIDPFRLPVQLVLRPQGALSPEITADAAAAESLRDFRASAGRIASGRVTVGDPVQVFPSGIRTTVTAISVAGRPVTSAAAPQSVALQLADDVDAARGSVIAAADTLPVGRREINAELFQLDFRSTRQRRARTRQARHLYGAGGGRADRLALQPRHPGARES